MAVVTWYDRREVKQEQSGMASLRHHIWTVQDYLAYERAAESKHEYLDGTVFAMAGASRNHNRIVSNTIASLHPQLRGHPCEIYPGDMRVKVSETGLYTYPDITVVCGAPLFEDNQADILLNPTLIIEVLSPSTESYDRGKKFQHYRTLNSLQEYVLISPSDHHIERYLRQGNQWVLSEATQPDATLELSSIQCRLSLAEVYENITFESESP